MTPGVYLAQPPGAIRATLALLRHFKAFLASDCRAMRDPTHETWRGSHDGPELDKAQAAARLRWLIDVAVNRKAGVPDNPGNGNRARRRLSDMRTRAIRERGCFECGARLGWLSAETAARMVARNPRLARDLENYSGASPGTVWHGWGRYRIHADGDYSRPYRPQPHYCGAC